MTDTYEGVMMPRRGGKTAFVIRRAIEHGGVILVNRESARQRVLDTAKIMGVEAPEVIVIQPKPENLQGITFASVIVDIDT